MNEVMRKAWVTVLTVAPVAALASAGGMAGGLNKATTALTTLQTFLLAAAIILVTIALMGCGIAMAFYKKRWEDLNAPVMGALVIGMASGLSAWLIN